LYYHPRDWRHQPKPAQVFNIGTKGLEYTGCIGILQGKAKLYPEKAETHIPYLPETKPWFFSHHLLLYG
jgi:hypothetical protein